MGKKDIIGEGVREKKNGKRKRVRNRCNMGDRVGLEEEVVVVAERVDGRDCLGVRES